MRLHLSMTAMLAATTLIPGLALEWTTVPSGVTARLRGVSVASDRVVWASGAEGTVVRSADGGATWQRLPIPDSGDLDFRDIDAVSESVAYVLSIGPGERSRIYKTSNAGRSWTRQFVSDDPSAFFDAMAFWDANSGVAFSDSADGRFHVRVTPDGGVSWPRVPADSLPSALPNEGAFAASGTNVATYGTRHVWIGTGAAAQARVLRSTDGGQTWDVSVTPLAAGVIAIGPSGADYSPDGGRTWRGVDGPGFHAFGAAPGGRLGVGVGEGGRIGLLR